WCSRGIGPVLNPLVPVISERKDKIAFSSAEKFGRGNQRDNLDCQGERADAGILFPTVLWANWSILNEVADSAPDHDIHATQSAQRILFREFSSENDGKADLVELNATPEWATVGEAVLVPASVSVLNGDEIRQHGTSVIDLSGPQKRQTGFDTIARPDQMIAANSIAGISPWHAQAGDDRTRIRTVLMHFENNRRKISLSPQVGRGIRNSQAFPPLLPACDESLAYRIISFT